MTYSEHELEFTFAKNLTDGITKRSVLAVGDDTGSTDVMITSWVCGYANFDYPTRPVPVLSYSKCTR